MGYYTFAAYRWCEEVGEYGWKVSQQNYAQGEETLLGTYDELDEARAACRGDDSYIERDVRHLTSWVVVEILPRSTTRGRIAWTGNRSRRAGMRSRRRRRG